MKRIARSEVDADRQRTLLESPRLAHDYARQFSELPLGSQLAVIRRRKWLSQKAVAKILRLKQPQIARLESPRHDPRLSSLVCQAKALGCHLIIVPDELLLQVAQLVAKGATQAQGSMP